MSKKYISIFAITIFVFSTFTLPAYAATAIPEVVQNATFAIVETPSFISLPANTIFYQNQYINISLDLQTPHEPVTVDYFLVNAKGNKKVKVDPKPQRTILEEMGAGLGISDIVRQKPGTYYYVANMKVGKKTYKLKTQTFIVKTSSDTSSESALPTELTVDFKPFEFWHTPTDHEYRLSFSAPATRTMADITGTLTVTCSRKINLYEKGGSTLCDKKRRIIYASLNDLDADFLVDADDLVTPVTLKAEFVNKNTNNKKVSKLKNKITLSR